MSRFDDIGLFWQDEQVERGEVIRPQPPIPDTGWELPTYFPDLSRAKLIAVDVETYDPELTKTKGMAAKGPGWARGKGHIVGISIGTDDGFRAYYPIRHEVEPEWNLDPTHVFRWLNDVLSNPKQPKVGANITYDIGWLEEEGVFVKGQLFDVQFAEALLNEAGTLALEDLGQKYLGEGKDSNLLYQWCADFYGGKPNSAQRKNIYRTPPRLTGYYAESDCDLPLRILKKQYKLLIKDGLYDLFLMECDLIRLTIAMRFEGVSVDIPQAEKLNVDFKKSIVEMDSYLRKEVGFDVNVNASASLKKVFDKYNLPYPLTQKGNPSFTKDVLNGVKHPIVDIINKRRHLYKFNSTFVESYILDSHVDGKVYGQFHQLRGEGGGTRSGRYSSSCPNLQNIPSRDKIWAPKVRGLFIPDEGHHQWRRFDYSQIEYRFLAHYALGKGANEIRAKFNKDPSTDYHQAIIDLIKQESGIKLDRKPAKTINFGLIYGMGVKTLSTELGLGKDEGQHLFETYHAGVPFAKTTMDAVSGEALKYGSIRTILNRKARFDLWEPARWSKRSVALSYEKARRMYGHNIKRAYSHKALNRKLQGSAADMMKLAMWKAWKDGVFTSTGIPRLTVHDELDFSDVGGKEEAFTELRHIMETCIKLKIPVKVDSERGKDWGHCK